MVPYFKLFVKLAFFQFFEKRLALVMLEPPFN